MAAALRAAMEIGFVLFVQAIDGDASAQDELSAECDCDPVVFDMMGAMKAFLGSGPPLRTRQAFDGSLRASYHTWL